MLRERLGILRDIDEYVGKYYSGNWVRKNVLQMTEDEIEEMNKEIEEEDDDAEDAEDSIGTDNKEDELDPKV